MKRSAGILLYRERTALEPEILIAHMGGPFWANRDVGAWSIPKGELEAEEDDAAAARREFEEELGLPLQATELLELGEARQSSSKQIIVFAAEGDLDPARVESNTFAIEWPPGSGRELEFPEIDRAAWFTCDEAREKLVKGQVVFVERLIALLAERRRG